MNVLIIGSAAREHALAYKVAMSALVTKVFIAPGNAGTELEPKCVNVKIAIEDINNLVLFAKKNAVTLTIVGPEGPLVAGIVDEFTRHDLPCLGPNKLAAQLEGSKAFAKDFMIRHSIPTAKYQVVNNRQAAEKIIHNFSLPVVLKEDGLASGKGVFIVHDDKQLKQTLEELFKNDRENKIVIEEFLQGEEASFIVLASGQDILPMATSQDHKARFEDDKGPNTGGMGAYSPAPILNKAIYQKVIDEVIKPTLAGLAKEGINYKGFIYAGLMITKEGNIKVLEYNCRLGDPEAQAILFRLKSDLVEHCVAALKDTLSRQEAKWDKRFALNVVLVADGYPGKYSKDDIIFGLDEVNYVADCKVFHAGTKKTDRGIVTNGGRVLSVTALGDYLSSAKEKAYFAAKKIYWNNMCFRKDIGDKGIKLISQSLKSSLVSNDHVQKE